MCSAVSPMAPGIDRKKSHVGSMEQGDRDNRDLVTHSRRSWAILGAVYGSDRC